MSKPILSKTSYIHGLQCLKYVYLYKKHYKLQDRLTPEKLAKFKRGHEVGFLAQELFPGGINLKPASHFHNVKAVANTQKYIAKQAPVIYEGAFAFDGVLIFIDILVNDQGQYKAYEVKSSLTISETYVQDAALQYYVLKGSGLKLKDMSVITVNKDYIKQGTIDIPDFFCITDINSRVEQMQEDVAYNIAAQKQTLSRSEIPDVPVGLHCRKPYDCAFMKYCWGALRKKPSVFDLDFLSYESQVAFYEKGEQDLTHFLNKHPLSALEKTKVKSLLNKTTHVETDALKTFFNNIGHNYAFLEILIHQPAIPLFNDFKPYMPLPFSIAVAPAGNNTEEAHTFFMDDNSNAMLQPFLENICEQYESLIVYDEKSLKEQLNDCLKHCLVNDVTIQKLLSKIIGLKNVFLKGMYISYKINMQQSKDEILSKLGLKNPFPNKYKINNIYEARNQYDVFSKTVSEADKQKYRQKIKSYNIECLKYLKRLYDFFHLKIR